MQHKKCFRLLTSVVAMEIAVAKPYLLSIENNKD
jgi:hypothetical protein